MSAVLGLAGEAVAAGCAEASVETGEACAAANFNSPDQTVISGSSRAVARASELLKAAGAKKVVPLPVSAPFHCALMRPAEEKLAPYLEATTFHPMTFPVVTNVDATPNQDPEAARGALKRQVCGPVRWVETVKLLAGRTGSALELGPGSVLAGLGKRTARDWPVKSLGTADAIEDLLASR